MSMQISNKIQYRRAVAQCPCGKPNKTRKGCYRFAPFVHDGQVVEGAGICYSCVDHYGRPKVFRPGDEVQYSPAPMEPKQWHFAPIDAVKASLSTPGPLLRQLSSYGFNTAPLSAYDIGSFAGRNVFWLQDRDGRHVTAQLQSFNDELRNQGSSWLHAEHNPSWPKSDYIPAFGEHLITRHRPVAVVEAAKTALICASKFDQFTWVATLGASRLYSFLSRNTDVQVVLFPDNDAPGRHWVDVGKRHGVKAVTDYWESCDEGGDFADVIIAEMQRPTIEEVVKAMPGFELLTQYFDWDSRMIRTK